MSFWPSKKAFFFKVQISTSNCFDFKVWTNLSVKKKCNKSYCRNCFACIILCEIHSELIPLSISHPWSWISTLFIGDGIQFLAIFALRVCGRMHFLVKCCKKSLKVWVKGDDSEALHLEMHVHTSNLNTGPNVCVCATSPSWLKISLLLMREDEEEEEKVPKSWFHLHSYSNAREANLISFRKPFTTVPAHPSIRISVKRGLTPDCPVVG